MTVLMVVVGVAIFVFGIAMVWRFVTRGARAATIREAEFDEVYDELVDRNLVDGTVDGGDRDAAWREFERWQVASDEDRLEWEEPAGE